jgi:hypothetical protein
MVFEFPDQVVYEQPRITREGVLSIVFYNSSTTLSPVKTIKKDPSNRVSAIDFVQNNSHLTAVVRLSSPHFNLKYFYLSNPHRVVVDAYLKPLPLVKPKGKEALGEKTKQETLLPAGFSSDRQPVPIQPQKIAGALTTEFIGLQQPKNIYYDKRPEKQEEIKGGILIKQSYWIAGLFALSAVFIMLLFLRLKKIGHKGSDQLFELVGFMDNSNKQINQIDNQLKNTFKKFEEG